jgi:serpin B
MEPLRRNRVITRRTLFQLAGLIGAGAVLPPLLSACSSEGGPSTTGLTLASSDLDRGAGRPEAIPDAVTGITGLAEGLLDRLGAQPGNLAFSPYSVAVALAMTVNGARGRTAQEMLDVLGVADPTTLNDGLNALTRRLEGLAGKVQRADGSDATLALDAANALFGQKGTVWEEPFLDELARSYGAGMQLVDYVGATETARGLINDWTAEQTHDRIPEIIPAGVLDALTRLVLVNAIYLKAPWEEPFDADATEPGTFHNAAGGAVDVEMMSKLLLSSAYAETEDRQAVRIAYAGRSLVMTVVLPRAGAAERVWEQVVGGGLADILDAPSGQSVYLRMPKWTFRTQAALNAALVELGMPTAFDETAADFSGMTKEEELHISAVLHEAFIAVDEEGTEAAAATAVVMGTTGVQPTIELTVDRPFLFVIHDTTHNTPLFVGRVDDPTA